MKPLALSIFLLTSFALSAQQVADLSYNPPIATPEYNLGQGPVVYIDEGHYNFHTKEGRYKSFANLLERDGYVVTEYQGSFELAKLKKGKILVISNALNEINVQHWYLPTPSAFTTEEIRVIVQWVEQGGSLFLIADHMPMGGAAADLAAAFGFEFSNGFVMFKKGNIPSIFTSSDTTLIENLITNGRNKNESVQEVASFTGQAFAIPDDATPILAFKDDHINLLPDTAWQFNENTKRENVKGLMQGAYKKYGKGRVVAFGEAAMFSAQLAGPNQFKMGMNSNLAKENYKLLLNIIHWLDGRLD